jgi:demethoxyubiquinone hydroxylase (CLK1/Coq7/Cat5 family)
MIFSELGRTCIAPTEIPNTQITCQPPINSMKRTSVRLSSHLNRLFTPTPCWFARRFNTIPTPTPDARQPGEKQALLDSFLRVDHAGEYGAVRIYEGQLAVLGKSTIGPQLLEMKEHEVAHLKTLQDVMPERRVRPTLLLPVWHVAGYALGTVHVLFHYNSFSLV